MMNKFEKITENVLIWWAMDGIRKHMETLSYRAADLRNMGMEENAEKIKKDFLDLKGQYFEICQYFVSIKLYDKETHDLLKKSIEKLEDLGWGDLEK